MSLLFIIFGRKVREKDYGPSYPLNCPRCDNEVYYHAYKWRSWFHLFWIPVIPWFSNKQLICPICRTNIELDRNEFKEAKALVEDTQQYQEDELTEQAYSDSIYAFEATTSFVETESETDETGEEAPNPREDREAGQAS